MARPVFRGFHEFWDRYLWKRRGSLARVNLFHCCELLLLANTFILFALEVLPGNAKFGAGLPKWLGVLAFLYLSAIQMMFGAAFLGSIFAKPSFAPRARSTGHTA